jgi:fucose permease
MFSLTFFGGMPLGALWAGPLADLVGAPMTLVISSAILLVFAVLFWLFAPHVRRLA